MSIVTVASSSTCFQSLPLSLDKTPCTAPRTLDDMFILSATQKKMKGGKTTGTAQHAPYVTKIASRFVGRSYSVMLPLLQVLIAFTK